MIKDKDCVRLLNKLAFLCDHQIPAIDNITEIDYKIISRIFFLIFNRRGVYPNLVVDDESEETQYASLVNFLASSILNISLDHIKPIDLVYRNPISLYNILEILAACELYLPFDEQKMVDSLKETVKITLPTSQAHSYSLPSSPSLSNHSMTWSSPTNSSLSNSTFSLTSSLSLSSISFSIPDPPVIESLSPKLIKAPTKKSTFRNQSSKKSSKSRTSSPDSACICNRLRDVAINTDKPNRLDPQSTESSSFISSSSKSPENKIKVDKATSIEPELSGKDKTLIDISQFSKKFDTLEALASHRFALEIGHKLQRALKLEEATKQIEAKLCAITGELNTKAQTKRFNKPNFKRSTVMMRKRQSANKPISRKTSTEASTKLNVYTKPLINSDRLQRLLKSKPCQSNSQDRLKLDVNSGQDLLDEWKRQSSALTDAQSALEAIPVTGFSGSQKLKHIRERSMIRDARTERARVHRLISDLERKTCSKYLATQSKEQQLIKLQAQEKIKSFRNDLLSYKDLVKNQMDKEQEKRKRLLDAFTHYYQQQLSLIKDKLDQEESDLTERFKHSNVKYNKLRRELKSNLEKEIGSLISS